MVINATCLYFFVSILLGLIPSSLSLAAPSVPVTTIETSSSTSSSVVGSVSSPPSSSPPFAGDWAGTKSALRDPECCVVSVPGLESHLRVLQERWADRTPAAGDVDLRMRVRADSVRDDCLRIRRSVSPVDSDNDEEEEENRVDQKREGRRAAAAVVVDPCTAALTELARGVASLADGPLEGVCADVFVRVVRASNYRAIDPPFHTDKAPLRGYATLRGAGTEFATRTCTPVEYLQLRALGTTGERPIHRSIRAAEELEFIVMKGDHYEASSTGDSASSSSSSSWLSKVWKRASACVHRSPPGRTGGGRRVIVSLDLADGDDDREWYQVGQKREWRSGMTQRKSRLVA